MFRSQRYLTRPEWSINRAHFKAMGYTDEDLSRPLIGIANAWSTTVPGHINLRDVARAVSDGIRMAGGTPVEFGVIGACDGLAAGHEGMRYILPTRDVIAHSIELMVQAQQYDALVLLGSCDKIVPGMLMAAARLDLPSILVCGGPMLGGPELFGRKSDCTAVVEGVGKLINGEITMNQLIDMENRCSPGCGSCSFLGTANTMCCFAEAVGMSLSGSAVIPAVHGARLAAAQESGRAVMKLLKNNITARQIMTRASLENAVRLVSAIGGSTNTALHVPAIAYEAHIDFPLEKFAHLSESTPLLAKMNPAANDNIIDYYEAGGVPATLAELAPLLDLSVMTAEARPLAENLKGHSSPNNRVLKTLAEPFGQNGGLAVLYGNLAPDGAVTKPAAIDPSQLFFTGPAYCFDSETEANEAILSKKIKTGQVVVIRYEGPKGGPGMPEMFKAMKLLNGLGLAKQTAVVTDGRFSGTNNGCFVGHISPEAQEGGPIALIKDGDMITIDIKGKNLQLDVSPEELAARLANWQAPKARVSEGYLYLYSRLAESAARGAIIKTRAE